MSMISVIATIRDNLIKQMDDDKPLQWICTIKQDDCTEPGKDCKVCDTFINFKGEKYGNEKQ